MECSAKTMTKGVHSVFVYACRMVEYPVPPLYDVHERVCSASLPLLCRHGVCRSTIASEGVTRVATAWRGCGCAVHPQRVTPEFEKALRRIFRLCDEDRDNLLSEHEITVFQEKCFGVKLGKEEIQRLFQVRHASATPLPSQGHCLSSLPAARVPEYSQRRAASWYWLWRAGSERRGAQGRYG